VGSNPNLSQVTWKKNKSSIKHICLFLTHLRRKAVPVVFNGKSIFFISTCHFAKQVLMFTSLLNMQAGEHYVMQCIYAVQCSAYMSLQ
jgi:hypothetical protein